VITLVEQGRTLANVDKMLATKVKTKGVSTQVPKTGNYVRVSQGMYPVMSLLSVRPLCGCRASMGQVTMREAVGSCNQPSSMPPTY